MTDDAVMPPRSAAGLPPHHILLGLGGNLGDVPNAMRNALRCLVADHCCAITAVSSLYESEPWGTATQQPMYCNAAAVLETTRDVLTLLTALEDLERKAGRRSKGDGQPRPLDLDLLDYDSMILHSARLTLPHPRLHLRRFVLLPLVEVAPEWIHPVCAINAAGLLARCGDAGATERRGTFWSA